MIEKFFAEVFKRLKRKFDRKIENLNPSLKIAQSKSTLFNKKPIKLVSQQIEQIRLEYQQDIQEIKSFQKIVGKIGAEQIKIFAAEPSVSNSKAGFSIPKASLKDTELAALISASPASSVQTMERAIRFG